MSWTPADLGASLALWLDAADLNTISLRDDEFVTAWDDKSGNIPPRNATQATASLQPTYNSTVLNGKPALDFSTHVLSIDAFEPFGAFSAFTVVNLNGPSTSGGTFVLIGGSNRTEFGQNDFGGDYREIGIISKAGTGTGNGVGADVAKYVPAIYGFSYDGSGNTTTDYGLQTDGSVETVVANGAFGWLDEVGFNIGGRPLQGLSYLKGQMSELIYLPRVLSTDDRQKVEGYLAWKWGGATRLWQPSDLGTSLALWLDAEDASTITLNGSNVTEWADKSGNTSPRNATQSTASLQPSYNAVTLNGKPTVSQTERGRYMDVAGIASVVNAYAVISATLGDNIIVLGSSGTPATTSELFVMGEIPTNTPNILLSFDGTASTTAGRYRFNGGTLSASDRNHNTTQPSPSNFILEGRFDNPFSLNLIMGRIGLATTDTNPMAMGELVWTSSVLSDADRQKLEGYLAHKWGLEANLPVDHPYKDAAPTVTLS